MTLHLNINSDRQQVGDVAAIYFVQPTRENIARIGKDCAAGLYDSMHLNFSSTIASDQLHSLATAVAEAEGGQQRIAKVKSSFCFHEEMGDWVDPRSHGPFRLSCQENPRALAPRSAPVERRMWCVMFA